jgi:hypothetical protein
MALTWTNLLALAIALGLAVTAGVVERSAWLGVSVFALCLLPLSLIWFADRIGGRAPWQKLTVLWSYETGPKPGWRPSHPAMVAFMGWFLLIGMPIILYLIRR